MARRGKLWRKIKTGKLQQVLKELAWISGYSRRYRFAAWLGIFSWAYWERV